MLLKLSLKLCLKKNPGEKQNGQLGELVLRSCDAFGECLKPQDPLIMIWLPIFSVEEFAQLFVRNRIRLNTAKEEVEGKEGSNKGRKHIPPLSLPL